MALGGMSRNQVHIVPMPSVALPRLRDPLGIMPSAVRRVDASGSRQRLDVQPARPPSGGLGRYPTTPSPKEGDQ